MQTARTQKGLTIVPAESVSVEMEKIVQVRNGLYQRRIKGRLYR